ncbi:PucR family transcriptional regulator [Lysinibacter sp. HNR]|uniref:helix-turn-helix domain-containing protein n=1 Tax=Lysinibacter sp. HNR TaxID=3031408 RepID=UPI0024353558|nr:PucR family transcriptional regulator [Lysinibacter sp. HNR]WGD37300.1 helix-turn-helix domain-containing protein [Lysinibacter sp. HNR]
MKTTPPEPTWDTLITRLDSEKNALVEDFLTRFIRFHGYQPGLVDAEDVRSTAVDTMDMFILQLAHKPLPASLADLPHRLGTRRARQGVALEAFLEAIRVDFRVLWKALKRVAEPDSLHLLVDNVELILNTVEAYVSQVQQAFLAEETRLTQDHRLARERTLSRLFNSSSLGDAALRDIAYTLGVHEDSEYELLAVTGESMAGVVNLYREAPDVHLYDQGSAIIVFREKTSITGWSDTNTGLTGGYRERIRGLAEIPDAATTAVLLASTHEGFVTVEDAWLTIARAHLESAIPRFSEDVLENLRQRTPHEQQRLIQVVWEFARTGSVKDTAQNLFCHRNTVINRLHTFQELTGLDLTIPVDAARALVVLSGSDSP